MRLRRFVLFALVLVAMPFAVGAMGLACGDDCLDSSCGDCVQCQVCGIEVATTPTSAPLLPAPWTFPGPDPLTTVAPARAIEHVPLPA